MFWVGQTNKWQVVLLPIFRKVGCGFRTDHYNFGILCCEFFIIVAQLRHVLLAEGSGKTTVEYQKNFLFFFEIRQANLISFEIRQREVWGWGVEFDAIHVR